MKELEITSRFVVYENIDELPGEIRGLMQKAIEARKNAYAPYSKFKVGAALWLENGEIVIGNNQENASYPSGLCAERVAVYQAGAKYPEVKINALAISAASDNRTVLTPIPPCGACRQSLAEYEVKQEEPIALYFMGETGKIVKAPSVKDLLPLLFDKSNL
ncbi:cytidine deaminase [Sinomicrobium weinanense]|uniref:Cytidine deaminase n=1 Tax=Sinomicrobium weinanense TaxID=2842200 RepID=A0A926Q465_9FLAO|nr:cytidine deaminase [Sinomicrobium weinanense]MBC9798293.1 cytidine deaminase [Sinomicrobium weinanense]MBU3124536.1 cytidine deaminase [Sinomicrobium weinanense]